MSDHLPAPLPGPSPIAEARLAEERKRYRRELIARAMQGLCAALADYRHGAMIDEDEIADDAIAIAEAVIVRLDREPK